MPCSFFFFLRHLTEYIITYYRSKALQSFACMCDRNAILPLRTVSTSRHSVSWIFIRVTSASKIKQEGNFKQFQLAQGLWKSPCLVGSLVSMLFLASVQIWRMTKDSYYTCIPAQFAEHTQPGICYQFFCVLAFIVRVVMYNLQHLMACIEKLICVS